MHYGVRAAWFGVIDGVACSRGWEMSDAFVLSVPGMDVVIDKGLS